MRIAQMAFNILVVNPFTWTADWLWSIPLVILTVIIHVLSITLVSEKALGISRTMIERRPPNTAFIVIVGTSTLFVTFLHGIEAGIWAIAYLYLGALPDSGTAMLYSLNAITSYGHASISLAGPWELMGALEALNGWLLFGLTTAFLFAVVQKVWLLVSKEQQ
jgi:MFS superfamily sulfate permease-like transporter